MTLGVFSKKISARSWRARVALAVLCYLGTGAIGGVPLVSTDGVPFDWNLDSAQPNVVAGQVTYYLDPSGTSDSISGPISGLAAVRAGISEWEISTTRIRFSEDGSRTANGRDGGDRVNWIGWVNGGLGRFTFAATFPTRSGQDILDMDVLFNDRDFSWDTRAPGISGVADIQALTTHEWGHALGLDHVPLRASTMYFSAEPGSTYFRTLSPDDSAVIGSIYTNAAFDQTTGSISGNVTRADVSNHLSIHVIAVSLVTGEPTASTLTASDGDFVLRGVPAGAYFLLAAPTVPLSGSMNAFWTDGRTDFVPGILRPTDTNPGSAGIALVSAGQETTVPAFTVQNQVEPFENDDSQGAATSIQLGDAVGARLEAAGDSDWYSFTADGGERVSVWVFAWHIGSDSDPEVALLDQVGAVIAERSDMRGDALFGRTIQGPDLDARLTAVELPGSGTNTYYVRVRAQGGLTGTNRFYALLVTPASESPSAALTSVTAAPLRLDAGGNTTSIVTVHPVKGTGEDVGTGATVDVTNDGGGSLSPVTDSGNGDYVATLTSGPVAAHDDISVSVTTPDGTATLNDILRIVYLGSPSAAQTVTTLVPRRIAADGAATATLVTRPRDAQGEDLGTSRSVVVTAAGDAAASASTDSGDGSYATTVTAGTTKGAVALGVNVEGLDLGALATVHLGFPLREVLAQAVTDIDGFEQIADVPNSASKRLTKARKKIEKAVESLDAENVKKAVARTKSASKKVAKAVSKGAGALPELGTAAELGQAIRETALEAIDTAIVGSDGDQAKVDKARLLIQDGDTIFAGGDQSTAVKRWTKAYKKVAKLQP